MKRAITIILAIAMLAPLVAATDDWSIRVTGYGPNLNPFSGYTQATGSYNGYNAGYYQDYNSRYINGYQSGYGGPSFGLGFSRPYLGTTVYTYKDPSLNYRTPTYGDWTLTQGGFNYPRQGISTFISRTPYRQSWGDAAIDSYSWGANYGNHIGYAPTNPFGARTYSNPWSPYSGMSRGGYGNYPYSGYSYPRTTSAGTSSGWYY